MTSRPFLELRATCAPRDTVERNPEREDRNRCEDAEPEVGAAGGFAGFPPSRVSGPAGESLVRLDEEGFNSLKLSAGDWPTPLSTSDSGLRGCDLRIQTTWTGCEPTAVNANQ